MRKGKTTLRLGVIIAPKGTQKKITELGDNLVISLNLSKLCGVLAKTSLAIIYSIFQDKIEKEVKTQFDMISNTMSDKRSKSMLNFDGIPECKNLCEKLEICSTVCTSV